MMDTCLFCRSIVYACEEYCPRCGSVVVFPSPPMPDTVIVFGETLLVIRWRSVCGVPIGTVIRKEVIR